MHHTDAVGGPMHGDRIDAREDLERWLISVERHSAQSAVSVRQLTQREGPTCNRLALAWLCHGLATAQGADRIKRAEVNTIANALGGCGNHVHSLRRAELDRLIGTDIDLADLHARILELARRLRAIEPTVDRRRPMARDLFRAALVHYVRETTGGYKDEEVSGLISAVERADYTTEAHVQWRHRAPAAELLTGPSPDVLNLLDEMREELAL